MEHEDKLTVSVDSHGADGPTRADVKWFDLQRVITRAKSDVLFVLDTCFAMTAADRPLHAEQGTKEYLVASGRRNEAAAMGPFTFTKQVILAMRRLTYSDDAFTVAQLHAELALERELKFSPIHAILSPPFDSITLVRCRTANAGASVPETPKCLTSSLRALISVQLNSVDEPDWREWQRWLTTNSPRGTGRVCLEGVFGSQSTLLIMSLPIPVWTNMSDHPACSFLGMVNTGNMMLVESNMAMRPVKSDTDSKVNKAKTEIQSWTELDFALYQAASRGNGVETRRLLTEGASPNATSNELIPVTALQDAITNQRRKLVEILLEYGADPNRWGVPEAVMDVEWADKSRFQDYAPLLTATLTGQQDIVRSLLKHGANANLTHSGYGTALQAAAAVGVVPIAKALIAAGADVDAPGGAEGSSTALQTAVDAGHESMVRLLLENGPTIEATAQSVAYQRGSSQITALLEDAKAKQIPEGGYRLLEEEEEEAEDVPVTSESSWNRVTSSGWAIPQQPGPKFSPQSRVWLKAKRAEGKGESMTVTEQMQDAKTRAWQYQLAYSDGEPYLYGRWVDEDDLVHVE